MTLPRVQPINPTRRREPFDDPNWLFDFKYDGFRGLFYVDRGGPRFDLESIVAKRLDDPYNPGVTWLKIKNPTYSQAEGRGDLFNGPRRAVLGDRDPVVPI